MALAAQADVEARLGRALTTPEEDRAPGLLDEASALIEAWFAAGGCTMGSPTPANVVLVVSRMVARVLKVADDEASDATAVTDSAGPFSRTRNYAAGASQGSPWINKNDRLLLRALCGGPSAAFNVATSP